jgi:hypothetical protein
VNLFAGFFSSQWRWLAFALAIIFAVLLLTQGADYASTWLARRRAAKQVDRTEQNHAARVGAEPRHQHQFDSTAFGLAGQRRELARTLTKIKHLDDSLTHGLPAAPALPADPPRQ